MLLVVGSSKIIQKKLLVVNLVVKEVTGGIINWPVTPLNSCIINHFVIIKNAIFSVSISNSAPDRRDMDWSASKLIDPLPLIIHFKTINVAR